MVKSVEEYKKELEKLYEKDRAADIAASDEKYETEKKLTTDQYNRQITDTEASYEDLYSENAVQKLINERSIAENMANLGLTDSGLNRTQQTAAQLSYANNKGRIDTAKQQAVDKLTYSLADAITRLDTAKTEASAGIRSNYASAIASGAQDMYNNALEAETERQKNYYSYLKEQANKEPTNIISANDAPLSRNFMGSLKDNGVTVTYNTNEYGDRTTTTYYDTVTGKKTTVAYSVNPYTGTNNAVGSSDTAKAWKAYGAFDNGYQPKGVYYEGKDYKYVSDSGIRDEINGNMQRVHKTKDGSLWIWDGKENRYRPYEE